MIIVEGGPGEKEEEKATVHSSKMEYVYCPCLFFSPMSPIPPPRSYW